MEMFLLKLNHKFGCLQVNQYKLIMYRKSDCNVEKEVRGHGESILALKSRDAKCCERPSLSHTTLSLEKLMNFTQLCDSATFK